jgi:hypothetical protein
LLCFKNDYDSLFLGTMKGWRTVSGSDSKMRIMVLH